MVTIEKVWRPENLYDAWALSQRLSDQSSYISGGTLLRTQWEAGTKAMSPHLISLDNIPDMREIAETSLNGQRQISIGAFTTLAQVIKSAVLKMEAPLLVQACQNIAAPSIRNRGTLGGNVLSKVGDAIPALLVLQAKLHWFNGDKIVSETVEESLMMNFDSQERILVSISVPISKDTEQSKKFSFYSKTGRRESFIPSLVSVAGAGLKLDKGQFDQVILAAGGGSMPPVRLPETEAILQDRMYSRDLLKKAYTQILKEYQAFDDPFATAVYKKKVAANVIISELWKSESDRRSAIFNGHDFSE
ncbi:FAD binding domain-containing protein [Salipaludibacillus sp. CF4.18]|uniref:FAD binding domain-containing protein n=1 Tax=Salipaludibacillus sp. CF4.18 TaxID=3373081 RepID=UPI003EE58DED